MVDPFGIEYLWGLGLLLEMNVCGRKLQTKRRYIHYSHVGSDTPTGHAR